MRPFDPITVPEDVLMSEGPDIGTQIDRPDSLVIYRSRPKTLLFLAIIGFSGLGMAGAAVLVYLVFPLLGISIAFMALVGVIAAIILAFSLLDRGPKIVLSDLGLLDNTTGQARFVSWFRILDAQIAKRTIRPFPAHFKVILTLVGRQGMESTREISVDMLTADPYKIADEIIERVDQARRVWRLR